MFKIDYGVRLFVAGVVSLLAVVLTAVTQTAPFLQFCSLMGCILAVMWLVLKPIEDAAKKLARAE